MNRTFISRGSGNLALLLLLSLSLRFMQVPLSSADQPNILLIFADDLTKDNVGDFPRRMEFVEGSIEIVTWSGRPWMRVNETARWILPLSAPLPTRYTLEFTFVGTAGECWIYPDREGRNEPYWRISADGGGGATLPGGRGALASGSDER